MLRDLLNGPVPPGYLIEPRHIIWLEALPDRLGWIAANDGIWRHIGYDDRARRDNGPIAYFDPRHDERLVADPDIIADDGVTLERQVAGCRHDLFPAVTEDLEWVRGYAGNFVIGAVHDEFDAAGDGAELTNDQPIADEREMIEDIALEVLRVFGIVVVRVIANDDIRVLHGVLDETHLRESFHWVFRFGVGAAQIFLLMPND